MRNSWNRGAEITGLTLARFGLKVRNALMDRTSKTIENEDSIGRLKLLQEKGVLHRQEATYVLKQALVTLA